MQLVFKQLHMTAWECVTFDDQVRVARLDEEADGQVVVRDAAGKRLFVAADLNQAQQRLLRKERLGLDYLEPAQREALLAFRARHGRRWKAILLDGWMRAAFPGPLQEIRNQFGPSWLASLRIPK